jgi:hypothetical protein
MKYCIFLIFLIFKTYSFANGFSHEQFATHLKIRFEDIIEIDASLGSDDNFSSLKINISDVTAVIDKSEFKNLEMIDLTSIKLLTQTERIQGNADLIMLQFNYGKEVKRKDPDSNDQLVYVRARVEFLFRGTKLIGRHRYLPDEKNNRWQIFEKSPDEEEINTGFTDSLLCPGSDPSVRDG